MNEIITNQEAKLVTRTPNLIAAEINNIKEQTKKMVLYNSIEIGRRLTEAKQLVPHGEWGEWLEKSVEYSKSTANNLMRIFEEYGSDQITFLEDNAKSQALGNLSYTQAVAMLGIPSEDRESFIKENDIDSMSTRELQQAIKEREKALKEKEEAEKAAQSIAKSLDSLSKENEKLKNETSKEREARLKAEREASELAKQIQEGINQRESYEHKINEYQAKLQDAQNSGDTEQIEELTNKLNTLDNEVERLKAENEELERQLKEKPIDVITAEPQVIEKVPDEIVEELQELRSKVNQNPGVDKATVKFSIQFDSLVKGFKDMLGTLEEISDIETKNKYKGAVNGLINKMLENL